MIKYFQKLLNYLQKVDITHIFPSFFVPISSTDYVYIHIIHLNIYSFHHLLFFFSLLLTYLCLFFLPKYQSQIFFCFVSFINQVLLIFLSKYLKDLNCSVCCSHFRFLLYYTHILHSLLIFNSPFIQLSSMHFLVILFFIFLINLIQTHIFINFLFLNLSPLLKYLKMFQIFHQINFFN